MKNNWTQKEKDLYGVIQKLIKWKINVFGLTKERYINYESKFLNL